MITISRNPNFTEWFDIRLLGKVVDNAKTRARANFLAIELQKEIKTSKTVIVVEDVVVRTFASNYDRKLVNLTANLGIEFA